MIEQKLTLITNRKSAIAVQNMSFNLTCDATWRRNRHYVTSGLAAAIFKNRLPVTSDSIRNGANELLDPENGGLAVETELLSCLEAEI